MVCMAAVRASISRVRGEAAAGAIATRMQAQSIIRASQAQLCAGYQKSNVRSAGMGVRVFVLAVEEH